MPLDVVIVALGTNDLKRKYRQTAQQLVANLLWYQAAMYDLFGNDSHSPSLLYVLPPNFAYREGGMSDEVRREVIELMEQSVGVERCVVAHDLDLSEDGLHLSPRGHVQLAGMVVRTYLSN
jgi:lysophospholipase L1-like esterase